jgi:hypothetical protein
MDPHFSVSCVLWYTYYVSLLDADNLYKADAHCDLNPSRNIYSYEIKSIIIMMSVQYLIEVPSYPHL